MGTWLPWLIVLGGPLLGAIAGGAVVHLTERIHWHRLAQTWYDDGYQAGWAAARHQYGTMVPDMVFTAQGTLEPVMPEGADQAAEAVHWDAVTAAMGAEFARIRASLYTP